MKAVVAAVIFLLVPAFSIAEERAARDVTGQVLEILSKYTSKRIGVEGVRVLAFDARQKLLCKARTDERGIYILEDMPTGEQVSISHERVKYRRNPEVWKGEVGSTVVVVYMRPTDPDFSYLVQIADAIGGEAESRLWNVETGWDYRSKQGGVMTTTGSYEPTGEPAGESAVEEWPASYGEADPDVATGHSIEQECAALENEWASFEAEFEPTSEMKDAMMKRIVSQYPRAGVCLRGDGV